MISIDTQIMNQLRGIAIQTKLKLIVASALAFAFVGSPVAQAQDRPLAQTLEALALQLEQW